MGKKFLIDDEKISKLSATRQGRISIGGFTYQASYAVARLASMYTGKSILSLRDIPEIIRYDWAEDLDEIDKNGCTAAMGSLEVPPTNHSHLSLPFGRWHRSGLHRGESSTLFYSCGSFPPA